MNLDIVKKNNVKEIKVKFDLGIITARVYRTEEEFMYDAYYTPSINYGIEHYIIGFNIVSDTDESILDAVNLTIEGEGSHFVSLLEEIRDGKIEVCPDDVSEYFCEYSGELKRDYYCKQCDELTVDCKCSI